MAPRGRFDVYIVKKNDHASFIIRTFAFKIIFKPK